MLWIEIQFCSSLFEWHATFLGFANRKAGAEGQGVKRRSANRLIEAVWPGAGYGLQALKDRATASGLSEAILSKTRAGPSGWRLPCSQFCRVETLMPIIRANSDWDFSSFLRINRTSAGSIWMVRPGFILPRLIAPACLTLSTSLSKSRSSFQVLLYEFA